MKNKKQKLITLTVWVVLLGIWFLTTLNSRNALFPSPKQVIIMLSKLFTTGYNGQTILFHLGTSLMRLGIAMFCALILAIPLGLLSGYSKTVQSILDSLVNFYRPLPPMSYYVLLIMWLGIDESSKIMLLFLAAFAPIYISCVSAVRNIDKQFVQSAQSLGASKMKIFKTIIIPGSLPEIIPGIRTALGVCYTTLISAEMIAATSGIGWVILDAYNYLKVDVVVACILIMGATGLLMDYIIKTVGNKLVFWTGK